VVSCVIQKLLFLTFFFLTHNAHFGIQKNAWLNLKTSDEELEKDHGYVFFCQMPKTKARSGAFQEGADVWRIRRQGHGALHHFETAHYCEYIGHYKKRHTHAPSQVLRLRFWS